MRENANAVVKTVQGFITVTAALLNSMLGVLYVPVLLVVACNVVDYITGFMAAPKRNDGKISSYKSMRGIKKKVSMWLLIVVGALIDQLIRYSAETLGFNFPFQFLFACIVSIWIVCNELISILENIIDTGISIPPFLMPVVKYIKSYAEKSVSLENVETEEK